ncbi:MAG: hypothetical protein VST72_02240 [Nitrospirota bacterium]|nr:hypothetical protein [Nitrospirota bacterium]
MRNNRRGPIEGESTNSRVNKKAEDRKKDYNTGPGDLYSEQGIALVMVLVLSFIALAIVSALLFMVTQGTITSGSQGFFRTAEEAGIGGAELAFEYMESRGRLEIPGLNLANAGAYANVCDCQEPDVYDDNLDLATDPAIRTCRCDKICNPTESYDFNLTVSDEVCDEDTAVDGVQLALNPAINPDIQFLIGNAPNQYNVSIKIVDTVLGNSDIGGVLNETLGNNKTVDSNSGIIYPPHNPYMYRIEVLAERATNPRERSRLSILYAY